MGSNPFAVQKMNGGMGSLVTEDLFQQVGRAVDEPCGQRDFGAPCAVAPERALELRTRAKADLLAQLRKLPELRPPDDRLPQFLYPLRVFSLHNIYF